MKTGQIVHIVDDDEAVRDSLSVLLNSHGLMTSTYPDAKSFLESSGMTSLTYPDTETFLESFDPTLSGCLVLDIQMPEMSGLHLQEELVAVGSTLPIIFLTGHAEVNAAVQALKSGAFDFLEKPFDHNTFVALVKQALEKDKKNRAALLKQREVYELLKTLTPRERQVLNHVMDAKATKVIAIEMGLSQRTIEIYRANVMQKMQSRSIAQLVRVISEFNSTMSHIIHENLVSS